MPRSIGRYLLLDGVLALAVNLVINAAVGNAIYGRATAVPLTGNNSIAGDTIVGAFLIAFFTLLIVAPAARREVRSGRVIGGGKLRLSRWFEQHPFLTAVAGGIVSGALVGGGAVAIVAASGVAPMTSRGFLAFKIAFAGVWGSLAAVGIAAVAVAGEPQPADDDRWSRLEPAPAGSYPCDYIDKGGLAITSARHGCSGTPTWQLVVTGILDPALVRAALADLLVRYPSLATRVRSLDAIPEYAKRFRYEAVPTTVDSIFELVDLRGRPAGELAALIRDVWDRDLDQFREPPMAVTMAITGDDRCHLLFRQHHGIADGRAFIGLLADFARFVTVHETGGAAAPPDSLQPIGRRGELEALGLSRVQRITYPILGFASLIRAVCKALVRPVPLLVQNESADYTGANGAIRWVVDDAAVERWKAAGKQLGASMSAVLTGALFLANQRWHRALGRRLGRVNASLMMETRPRDGSFVSFANHLGTLEAELSLDREVDRELDAAAAIRSIHAQLKRQLDRRRPIKRLVCERPIVAGMPLDKLHALVFGAKRPAFNLNLSNLIPLDFPVLAGRGWTVDEVLITTPVTPRTGIALTVVRYHGRVYFNFNHAEPAVTTAQVTELARRFREALEDITGYRAPELATEALDSIQTAQPAAASRVLTT